MISLVGFKEVVRILYTVSKPYILKNDASSYEGLKSGIFNFLRNYHSDIDDVYTSDSPKIVEDGEIYERILELMDISKADLLMSGEHRSFLKDYSQALLELEKLDEYNSMYHLIVNTVALSGNVREPGSSTATHATGIVWIQPEVSWTKYDYLESIIHEMTHIILGYDDVLTPHYNNIKEIHNKDTWVPSAIRNEKRPVNGVVHSIFVCNEIINLREKVGYELDLITLNKSSLELIESSLASINYLKANEKSWFVLSERMKHLLEKVELSLVAIKESSLVYEK